MITPLAEVTVESLTKSIANHVSCAILMLSSDLIQFVSVEGLSISDGDVHFVLDSAACQLVLTSFSVVLELIEDVM